MAEGRHEGHLRIAGIHGQGGNVVTIVEAQVLEARAPVHGTIDAVAPATAVASVALAGADPDHQTLAPFGARDGQGSRVEVGLRRLPAGPVVRRIDHRDGADGTGGLVAKYFAEGRALVASAEDAAGGEANVELGAAAGHQGDGGDPAAHVGRPDGPPGEGAQVGGRHAADIVIGSKSSREGQRGEEPDQQKNREQTSAPHGVSLLGIVQGIS